MNLSVGDFMQGNDGRARLGHNGSVTYRAQGFLAKAAAFVVGGAMLVGAFAISIVFFTFALSAAIVFGGYLWWKTRAIRRQMREHLQRQTQSHHQSARPESQGDVIEGVVISRSQTRDDGRFGSR